MAGRKPKPTAVKKLEGNPDKRKLNTRNIFGQRKMKMKTEWISSLKTGKSFMKTKAEIKKIVSLSMRCSDRLIAF